MRRTALLGLTLLLSTALATGTAGAAGDPYAADPLGLVPFIDTAQQVYSSGTDTWPSSSLPQHSTLPSARRPQLWKDPTLTSIHGQVVAK